MIPRYPTFRPLSLSDATEVNAIAFRFPPYSDFNFVSLWSWNTTDTCSLSTLHGNLVVRMADYVTNAPFYSFLGDGAPTETAAELIRRSREEGLGSSLRLVPEFVAHRLERQTLLYEMDMDGSDYVLSAARLRRFEGQTYRTKRKEANRFAREHPGFRVERLDLGSRAVADSVLSLFDLWSERKGAGGPHEMLEYRALGRLLQGVDFLPDLHALGVYVGDRLVAFAIIEFVQQRHAMGHFLKADSSFPGLYSFLMREIGEFLASAGYEHLNAQQDLGLPGLRQNKSSYVPTGYLRKYLVIERAAASRRPSRPALLSVPAAPDAFLTNVSVEAFGPAVSLRAPSLSSDLRELARKEADQERRAALRQSAITRTRPAEGEDEESSDDEPGSRSSSA